MARLRRYIARQSLRLFDLDISQVDGGFQAALSGEIDLSTVGDLEERLQPSIDGGAKLVVLDLREVTFLDSSGLRLLLRINEGQRAGGGRLVIVQGGRRVARVLELTGAGEELEIVDDPSQAFAS